MTVLSDLDDDIPLDALIQKKKNENNNGNKEPEKLIPLSGKRQLCSDFNVIHVHSQCHTCTLVSH